MPTMKNKYIKETKNLPDSRFEIKVEIPWEDFAIFEDTATANLSKNIEIDGFRKGNVPKDIALKQIGDEMILGEMVQIALEKYYPEIIKDQNMDFIGRPDLSVTKMARGNELAFTITASVLPEIKLPDYKKIAKSVAKPEAPIVTDEDVDKVIEELRQLKAYGHVHGPEDNHSHDEPLPEVNDDFAKSFGEFKNLEEMKEKIRENIIKDKEFSSKDKRRVEILDQISKETNFEIPKIVIDSEKQKMLSQIETDIARSGITFEAYLKQLDKTKDDILKEFEPEAIRRAKFQLLINAISKEANLIPKEEDVEKEANKIMETYAESDKNQVMAYADMLLTNQAVLSMLENL